MKGIRPFHEAIVDEVNKIDTPSLTVFKAVLLALAELTKSCRIPANHDAIAKAFRERMEVLLTYDFRNFRGEMDPLFNHIDSEKERCALEIATHLQKRDGKKRRSSFDASTLRKS